MVRGAGFEGGYHEPIFRGFLESVRIAAHPLPFKDGPCDAMPAGLPPVPIGQGKPWLGPGSPKQSAIHDFAPTHPYPPGRSLILQWLQKSISARLQNHPPPRRICPYPGFGGAGVGGGLRVGDKSRLNPAKTQQNQGVTFFEREGRRGKSRFPWATRHEDVLLKLCCNG